MTGDSCPECGASLVAEHGGSHLIGQVENDRIASWLCPFCEQSWPRDEPWVARHLHGDPGHG